MIGFKPLYNDDTMLTSDGVQAAMEVEHALRSTFESYVDRGYSPEEVSYLMHSCVDYLKAMGDRKLRIEALKANLPECRCDECKRVVSMAIPGSRCNPDVMICAGRFVRIDE